MNINDLTFTSIETISVFNCITGAYRFTLDELQNAAIAQSHDTSDILGKQGRKITTLKRNKAITVSGSNGLVSGGLLEMQTGDKFVNKTTEVLWSDYLTVKSNKANTTYKAVGTTGKEILTVVVKQANGIVSKELTQGAEVKAGTFTYTPTSKLLTFNSGDVPDDAEIVVKYMRKITADTLDGMSDSFSDKGMIFIDALAEDKCSNVYRVQFFIPKADFKGEFSLEIGDSQTVHSFEAEALAGACGAAGRLWSYTIFGADTADAA